MHQTAGLTVLDNKEGLPWSVYTGIAGMPGALCPPLRLPRPADAMRITGHTAYSGWKEFAKPQKGDVVFVSSGSGQSRPTNSLGALR